MDFSNITAFARSKDGKQEGDLTLENIHADIKGAPTALWIANVGTYPGLSIHLGDEPTAQILQWHRACETWLMKYADTPLTSTSAPAEVHAGDFDDLYSSRFPTQ